MKRYKAINFEYDDAYGTGTALDIVEHDEGEWVKYDDIKHLLQNTSSNSDYTKCTNEVFKYVTDNICDEGITKKVIKTILKKHFA